LRWVRSKASRKRSGVTNRGGDGERSDGQSPSVSGLDHRQQPQIDIPRVTLAKTFGDDALGLRKSGFGTFAGRLQVDSNIAWMKLASLAEVARLA
jgi:hypothetical protein